MTDVLNFDVSEIDGFDLNDLEVLSVSDALALPETGASSAISSCNSCSSCGSSSCFQLSAAE
jgi:thiazolylpeptide-type bacteriocin precursor